MAIGDVVDLLTNFIYGLCNSGDSILNSKLNVVHRRGQVLNLDFTLSINTKGSYL